MIEDSVSSYQDPTVNSLIALCLYRLGLVTRYSLVFGAVDGDTISGPCFTVLLCPLKVYVKNPKDGVVVQPLENLAVRSWQLEFSL